MIKLNKISSELNAQVTTAANRPIITPAMVRLVIGLGLFALTITPVLSDPGSPW